MNCVNDHLVVAVKNQSIAFSKLSPPYENLGESHVVALSPARRTPEGVIEVIGDWMQRRDGEFDRIWITCTDPALRQGLAAVLRTAVEPGWLDRVTLRSGDGRHAAPDTAQAAVAGPRNRRSALVIGGAAIAGAAGATVASMASSSFKRSASKGSASSGQGIAVDQLGASDDERIKAINELTRRSGGIHSPVFEFANRQYVLSTPIKLYSGLKLFGTRGLPAREYDGGTTIRWEGEPNTSIFVFAPEGQAGQAFPADGSPRDISISGILFEGGWQTDVFPRLPMTAASVRGNTLWYCNLHNLGVRAMRTFWWGYGTGTSLTGTFHAQAMLDTPLYLGGSENTIFGTEAQSFMDNNSTEWTSSGKPFIRSQMSKSFIGRVIITAQLNSYHLSIEGGRGLHVSGVQFDAPSSIPSNGSAVKVSGVDGLTISNCVFYSNMANPGNDSRGIIDISGGREIVIVGNQFLTDPTQRAAGPASLTPIVYCSSPDPVKIGLNGFPGYAGVVRGNAIALDPGVKVNPT